LDHIKQKFKMAAMWHCNPRWNPRPIRNHS